MAPGSLRARARPRRPTNRSGRVAPCCHHERCDLPRYTEGVGCYSPIFFEYRVIVMSGVTFAPAFGDCRTTTQFRSQSSRRPCPVASFSSSASSPAACISSCAVWWLWPTTFGTRIVFVAGVVLVAALVVGGALVVGVLDGVAVTVFAGFALFPPPHPVTARNAATEHAPANF